MTYLRGIFYRLSKQGLSSSVIRKRTYYYDPYQQQQCNDDTNTIIIPAERFAFKPLHTTMARAKGRNKAAEVPTKTTRRVHSYRSTDQGITSINAKKMVLRMESIFDYAGIKAPNVPMIIICWNINFSTYSQSSQLTLSLPQLFLCFDSITIICFRRRICSL